MRNPITHILLNSESIWNSIANIYVLAAIIKK